MTIIFESLPYIDANPTPQDHAAAQKLITAELTDPEKTAATPHPSLRPLPTLTFPPLFASYLESSTDAKPDTIDLSRYEAQEPLAAAPSSTTSESLERTREALSRAYVSNSYLSWREEELQLLEQHGKNAWLVHNWQLESDLKVLEAELARARADVDRLTVERQRSQQMVEGEMKGLEEQWRKGVGRVLEVEVAVEGVKGEIRERMRG